MMSNKVVTHIASNGMAVDFVDWYKTIGDQLHVKAGWRTVSLNMTVACPLSIITMLSIQPGNRGKINEFADNDILALNEYVCNCCENAWCAQIILVKDSIYLSVSSKSEKCWNALKLKQTDLAVRFRLRWLHELRELRFVDLGMMKLFWCHQSPLSFYWRRRTAERFRAFSPTRIQDWCQS